MADEKLGRYREMRDFSRTAEPSGLEPEVAPSERPRFVIQKHAATRLHFDLRLEWAGVFKSWAVTKGPSQDPHDRRLAVQVEDHPLAYGDFEGSIPKGEYGGGTVLLWDRGFWAPEPGFEDVERALANGELKFVLEGERLHGGWVLVRMKPRGRETKPSWLLIKHKDAGADVSAEAPSDADRSVGSGRTMDEIARGRGAPPTPFMTGRRLSSAAVWTREGLAPDAPRPKDAASSSPRTRSRASRAKASAAGGAPPPAFVEPELARLVDHPPRGEEWAHEPKLDGYRAQARIDRTGVRILTRKGLDWTAKFGRLGRRLAGLAPSVLDGEIVVLNDQGAPDFSALQAALSEGASDRLVYFVFDLLFDGGEDLRSRPLRERKERLRALLAAAPPEARFVDHFHDPGDAVLKSACRMGLEGVVSKRLSAPYVSGRSEDWLKSKCRQGQEVVVGGWTETGGAFRSLLVGVNAEDGLRYAGRVGTGFNRTTAEALAARLRALESGRPPFRDPPKVRGADVRWARPELVAEIAFAGFTSDGLVRQASFKGVREDKPAAEVRRESPEAVPNSKGAGGGTGGEAARARPTRSAAPRTRTADADVMGVRLSHPDKALWPDDGRGAPVTKRDLALYFEAVAELLLPHIRGRPCSIVRMPDGVEGERFFQRHLPPGSSALFTPVLVYGERKPYLQIDRPEALAAAAQVGAVELHPWNCAPFKPQEPGRLVFDFDPAPDVPFTEVVAAALEMRERLKALGLESFCKTTGGKGLHVVTPVEARGFDWAGAKAFAREVCRRMAADAPDRFLINMAKAQRGGRIFLDYLRNDSLSTAVAPFSPRGRPGAPVSTPISWSEAKPGLDPLAFTVRTVPERLRRRPWSGYEAAERPLSEAVRRLGPEPKAARGRSGTSGAASAPP